MKSIYKILTIFLILLTLCIPALAVNYGYFYINATQDGSLYREVGGNNLTYPTFRNATSATTHQPGTSSIDLYVYLRNTQVPPASINGFYRMDRYYSLFNLSASNFPANSTITGGRFEPYMGASTNGLGSPNYTITQFSPATNGTIITADYNNFIDDQWSAEKLYSSLSGGRTYFTLNDLAISNISAIQSSDGGWFNIMMRDIWDVNTYFTGTYNISAMTYVRIRPMEAANGSYTPRLNLTYTKPPEPPVADFNSSTSSHNWFKVLNFTDNSLDEPFYYAPDTWNWSYQVNGTPGWTVFSTSQNPQYNFTIPIDSTDVVTWDINLTVSNGAGEDTEIKCSYVTVQPPAPVANFNGTPLTGNAPIVVTFTDTSQYSPASWSWDFGDSSTENNTMQNPVHTYTTNGKKTVSLTVTNSFGSDTETKISYVDLANVTYGDHPLLLFRNITEVPGFQNRYKSPWNSWEANIRSNAARGLTYTDGDYVEGMGIYYHICKADGLSDCSKYVNRTVDLLVTASFPVWGSLDRRWDGHQSYDRLADYVTAYDLIAGVNKTTGGTTFDDVNDTLIRDNIANWTNDSLSMFPYYNSKYYGFSSNQINWVDRKGSAYTAIGMAGEALYDYDTSGKGLATTPAQWQDVGTDDYLVEDSYHNVGGRPDMGAKFWGTDPYGGMSQYGAYIYYTAEGEAYTPIYISNVYGNVFENYPYLKNYYMNFVYSRLPNGYQPSYVTGANYKLDYWKVAYPYLDNVSRAYLRWSEKTIEHNFNIGLLPYSRTFEISSTKLYLTVDDYSEEPYYHPVELNWLTPEYEVLRTSWDERTADYLSLMIRAWDNGDGRETPHPDDLRVEYYGHGDMVIPDAGEIKSIGYRPDSDMMHAMMVLVDPSNDWWDEVHVPYGSEWLKALDKFGSSGSEAWYVTQPQDKVSNPAIGYVEASGKTTTRSDEGGYASVIYGPIWGDTIYWNRSIISPGNEYFVVIDRTKSSAKDWNFKNIWRFSSFDITRTEGTYYPNIGHVHGDISIDNVAYNWSNWSYPYPFTAATRVEAYIPGTHNLITWNTTNPYGDDITTEMFTSPAANMSYMKWVTRIASYTGSWGEVFAPHMFFTTDPSKESYRLTAISSSWRNGSDRRTPSELSVTGNGAAIKVISHDGTKIDRIYTGNGLATFDTFETDASTVSIRSEPSGSIYSFTVINGTYLDKSGSDIFNSTLKLDYVSTYKQENGTIFNISGNGDATIVFHGVPTPTTVKKDGVVQISSGNWSMSGDELTITTLLTNGQDHKMEFTNGNEVYYPPPLDLLYETSEDEGMGEPTEVFYADNTFSDAKISRSPSSPYESYDVIRDGVGTGIEFNGSGGNSKGNEVLLGSGIYGNYSKNTRFGWTANTSSIPDDAVITDAWFSVYGVYKIDGVGAFGSVISDFSPTNPTLLSFEDYNRTDNLQYSNNMTYSSYSASSWNDYHILNLSSINKTGYTSLMLRNRVDMGHSTPTWANGVFTVNEFWDTNHTTTIPKLSVMYESPSSTPPTAIISAAPLNGSVVLQVFFDDVSIVENLTSRLWTFEGTNTSTEQSTTWNFTSYGVYNVSLYIENDAGSDTAYQLIHVGDASTVSFTATPTNMSFGTEIQFNGTSGGSPISWNWSFGDGNLSTQQNPTYTYPFCGIFSPGLMITDMYGSNFTEMVDYITVSCPIADFSSNATYGYAPLEVTFTDESQYDPTSWAWYWYNNETVSSNDQNPMATFSAGIYDVRLFASNDGGGNWSNKTGYITSNEMDSPVSNFTTDVTYGAEPLSVQFTDTSTNAPTSWNWSFRNVTGNNTEVWFSQSQNPSTIFRIGNFSIKLNASNSYGYNITPGDYYINVTNASTTTHTIILTGGNMTDGLLERTTDGYWSTIRTSAGTYASGTGLTIWVVAGTTSTTDVYSKISVSEFVVNTASIPDNATIISAKLGIKTNTKNNDLGNPGIVIINTTDMSSGFASSDYQLRKWGNYSDVVPYSSFTSGIFTNISFNSYGIENINKTGNTFFVLTTDWDSANNPPTFIPSVESYFSFIATDYSGTSSDPYMEIVYEDIVSTPVSSFIANTTNGTSPLSVQFTDTSINTPTNWNWSFRNTTGNNTEIWFSQVEDPSQIFGVGNFSIKLNVSNSAGYNITPGTYYINASESLGTTPVSSFIANTTNGTSPLSVQFADTSTNIPTSWNWSFRNTTGNNTEIWFSQLQNPSQIFGTGNFSIKLNASNSAGYNITPGIYYINITTLAPLPIANFTYNNSGGAIPVPVQFTSDSITSILSYNWSFGDGNFSEVQNPLFVYNIPGLYSVSLNVTNASGYNTTTKTNIITIGNIVLPIPIFSASNTSGTDPLVVRFTSSSITSILSYNWSFGDGNFSTSQNPLFIYDIPGTYNVVLNVTNASGYNITTKTNYITVDSSTTPVIASFSATQWSSSAYPVTVTFTDTSTGSPNTWLWDFGDGSTSTLQNPSHEYTNVGLYTVKLTSSSTITGYSDSETCTQCMNIKKPPVYNFSSSPQVDIVNSTYNQEWLYYLMVENNTGGIWEFPIIGFASGIMGPFTDAFAGFGGGGTGGIVYLILWGLFLMMLWRQSGKITMPALLACVTAGAWGLLFPESAQPWCIILLAAAIASQLLTFFAKE